MSEVPPRDQLTDTQPVGQPDIDLAGAIDELGDAVEEFIQLTETTGRAPDLNNFLSKYPEISDELRSALEGLAMVKGLLSSGGSSPFGSSSETELLTKAEPLLPGSSLAGYRIVRELGYGGMGVVYEAVHVDLDRPVALKILRPWSGGSARRRFLNEARTAASLHHTNIVPVFDVGQSGSTSYYAMQKIDGEGLERWIRRYRGEQVSRFERRDDADTPETGPKAQALSSTIPALNRNTTNSQSKSIHAGPAFENAAGASVPGSGKITSPQPTGIGDRTPPAPDSSQYSRWVAQVGSQAALALDYAHKRHVIHRDIKPSNLILDESGTIWVADFGLALRLDNPDLSKGDGVLGTPRYTSPEQAARKVVDHRTDIYSLGATLYELLTLRPPYDGETSDEVLRKILTESAPLPHTLVPNLSRDLETIIIKAMSRRPEDRYTTAGELAEDLERFLNYEPVKARRIGPVGRMWRLSRRHPAVSAVSLVALTLVLGIATFAYRRVASERDDALIARAETLIALSGEKRALEKAKSSMRNQLWREASLVRLSAVPDRRRNILDLVKEALAYDPEPELRTKLRDEVVQALCLSDVRQEIPLVEQRVAGFEVINGGLRAASVSEDGRILTLWDMQSQKKTAEILLETLFDQSSLTQTVNNSFGTPGRGFDGIPGGLLSRRSGRVLVPVGSQLGVLRPDGRGILWIDGQTADLRGSWESPDQGIILAVVPVGNQPKILTIEYYPNPDAEKNNDRRQPFGAFSPQDELKILVHDLEKPNLKPLLLDKFQPLPERGRFVWPVLSVSPDGSWVALSRMFDEQIRILDIADARELSSLSAQVPVTSIAAGPDRLLAVAGGGSIRLWQNEPKREQNQLSWSTVALPSFGTHLGSIRQIRFSPDRNLIAASGRTSGIELWDIKSGEPVATFATVGQVDHMAFAESCSKLLASMDDPRNGGLRVWSIDEPVAKSYLSTSPENVVSLAVLDAGDKPTVFAHTYSGQVWLENSDCQAMKPLSLQQKNDRFGTVQTDGQNALWLFSGSDAMVWNQWAPSGLNQLSKPSDIFSLPDFSGLGWSFRGFGLTRMPASLAFAEDTNRVVLSRGSMICLLDRMESHGFLPLVPESLIDQFQSTDRHDDDDRRRRSEFDRHRNRDTGQPPDHTVKANQNQPTGFVERDGNLPRRPTAATDAFPVFNGSRGLSTLVRRIALTADGRHVAVLRGESFEFWEIGSLRQSAVGQIWSVRARSLPPGTPQTGITAMAVSPDGNWLALGTRDGNLVLISVDQWRVIADYPLQIKQETEPHPITDLSFTAGNQPMLAIAGHGGVAIWKMKPVPQHYLTLPLANNSNTPAVWDSQGNNLYLVDDQKHILKFDIQEMIRNISEIGLAQ